MIDTTSQKVDSQRFKTIDSQQNLNIPKEVLDKYFGPQDLFHLYTNKKD